MSGYVYEGTELELFTNATVWKAYWQGLVRPYIRGHVLEVGAGIGSNTAGFATERFESWTCLEPDQDLAERIPNDLDDRRRVVTGTLTDVSPESRFDAILYIDVLEHIADDRGETTRASRYLADEGCLVVLAPAHPFLYSEFDRAVGHCRRYTRASLRAAVPAELHEEKVVALDSVGLLASLGNRWLLNQAVPTRRQIATWDRFMVRLSRVVDPVLGYQVGKSVLGVWRKTVC